MNTSVSNDEVENEITIFPNPFTNKIYTSKLTEQLEYRLMNGVGHGIWSGKNIEHQDFSHLINGVYFLTISNKRDNQTIKLIKR